MKRSILILAVAATVCAAPARADTAGQVVAEILGGVKIGRAHV